jgi:hypothetical protein
MGQIAQVYDAAHLLNLLPCSFKRPEETYSFSPLERDFSAIVKKHGYPIKHHVPLPALEHAVDFTMRASDGRTLWIETDGHFHFTRSVSVQEKCFNYNGHTLIQSALICKLHPDITMLRLPSDDFKKIKIDTQENQRSALEQIIGEAPKIPGIYRVGYNALQISFEPIMRAIKNPASQGSRPVDPGLRL